ALMTVANVTHGWVQQEALKALRESEPPEVAPSDDPPDMRDGEADYWAYGATPRKRELEAALSPGAPREPAIRELITTWRKQAERHAQHGDCYRRGQGWGLKDCADELEAALASGAARAPQGESGE
ncbi:MAG TPA: hypothetical protein VEI97_06340, partial [bacterium]|nr:hypothetical protein [bacterium]